MTWEQVQQITLQKLFATAAGKTVQDDTTKDYLRAMPAAANEAIQNLVLRGQWRLGRALLTVSASEAAQGLDLGLLLQDFIAVEGVYAAQGGVYQPVKGWKSLAGVLFLHGAASGQYMLHYRAMPAQLSADTPLETRIELCEAAAALLPLYIASQLYKDDDAALATLYRNEFEAGADNLRNIENEREDGFAQVSGWCT